MLYVKLEKGPIWDTPGGVTILEDIIRYSKRMGLQAE